MEKHRSASLSDLPAIDSIMQPPALPEPIISFLATKQDELEAQKDGMYGYFSWWRRFGPKKTK